MSRIDCCCVHLTGALLELLHGYLYLFKIVKPGKEKLERVQDGNLRRIRTRTFFNVWGGFKVTD